MSKYRLTYGDEPTDGATVTWCLVDDDEPPGICRFSATYDASCHNGSWLVRYQTWLSDNPFGGPKSMFTRGVAGWDGLKERYRTKVCYPTFESAQSALIQKLRAECDKQQGISAPSSQYLSRVESWKGDDDGQP